VAWLERGGGEGVGRGGRVGVGGGFGGVVGTAGVVALVFAVVVGALLSRPLPAVQQTLLADGQA